MSDKIERAQSYLNKYFGYSEFRPAQKEIIEKILMSENVVAVMPTGAGKSICYQIPALMADNFSIIVSPLIALMKDQVDNLNKKEEIAAFINSTLEWFEIENTLNKVYSKKIKLLYLAPERLDSKDFAEKLKSLNPEYLFIDEAHCISEWGHNFRPSYIKLKNFIEFIGMKKVSAFTATATPEVISDIISQLNLKEPKVLVKGFERENISIHIFKTDNKKNKLLEILKVNPSPTLIYTSIRRKAELINQFLNLNKFKSEFYHAGINSIIRKKIQEEFLEGNIPIIVATNAFGMGIDKKDIRTVIHYDIPASIESYYQEFGRAGRDGKPANVFLFFKDNDLDVHRFFINNSYPTKEVIQTVYNGICDYAQVAVGNIITNDIQINYDFLKSYGKIKLSSALIHSSLKYLERAEYLKINSVLLTSDSMVFLFNPENLKKFVKRTLNNELKILILFLVRKFGNRIFTSKINLDYKDIEINTGLSQDNIKDKLSLLKDLGIIEYYQFEGKETVTMLKPRVPKDKLQLNFDEINKYYLIAYDKLEKMKNLVDIEYCRFRYILNYFGQNCEGYNCGKCDNCTKNFIHKFQLPEQKQLEKSTESDEIFDYLELFNKLNKIRLKVAQRLRQTPNMICPDHVLVKISKEKPDNKLKLMSIEGFNLRMFNKIGEEILNEINNYNSKISISIEQLPDNISETYKLIKKGYNLDEISKLRKLDVSVVSMQIETLISLNKDINIDKIISSEKIDLVEKLYRQGYKDLITIKKKLRDEFNFEMNLSEIRIAVAKLSHKNSIE
ncbi:MAG: RecQ family ATP-dependent DNA helicase [Ignavibacterium sp.]|nr:RecQ family ATP-dependent DNA helicase [Ignavibacterium sp.]